MGFRLVQKPVTLNDLNGVIAIILRYLAKFSGFRGELRKSG